MRALWHLADFRFQTAKWEDQEDNAAALLAPSLWLATRTHWNRTELFIFLLLLNLHLTSVPLLTSSTRSFGVIPDLSFTHLLHVPVLHSPISSTSRAHLGFVHLPLSSYHCTPNHPISHLDNFSSHWHPYLPLQSISCAAFRVISLKQTNKKKMSPSSFYIAFLSDSLFSSVCFLILQVTFWWFSHSKWGPLSFTITHSFPLVVCLF